MGTMPGLSDELQQGSGSCAVTAYPDGSNTLIGEYRKLQRCIGRLNSRHALDDLHDSGPLLVPHTGHSDPHAPSVIGREVVKLPSCL
jgi:hypothetical protein